jgi:hypothetical protein
MTMTEKAAGGEGGEGGDKTPPASGGDGGAKAATGGEGGAKAAAGDDAGAFDPAKFVSLLDDDSKKVWTAKGWAHPNDAIKGYASIEKMQGGEKLPMPNVAMPEKLGDWEGWKALGVPEKADGYEIKRPDLASGIQWDEEFEKTAKEAGAMLKLAPWQLQGMADIFAARMNAMAGQQQTVSKSAIDNVRAELAGEWGPKTEANFELAQTAARYFRTQGGLDENDIDGADRLLGSKGLMKMMAMVGGQLAEAKLIGGGNTKFGTGAAQADAELQRFDADAEKQKARLDRNHPQHKAVIEERARLVKLRDDGATA